MNEIVSRSAEINKDTETMTYRGMEFSRQEVEFMAKAFANFDELKSKFMQEHAENYGIMEKYTG